MKTLKQTPAPRLEGPETTNSKKKPKQNLQKIFILTKFREKVALD